MRAFITGADGFAGTWLRQQLRGFGHEITAPRIDVTDRRQLERAVGEARPDWLFHLAAVSDPGQCAADPDRAMAVNAGGTANVLAAVEAAGLDPVVLVTSSSAVYAPSPDPLTEWAPLRDDHPYVLSKLAAEEVCERSAMRVIVARPFNHTGPGQPPIRVIPALAAGVRLARSDGGPVRVGNLDVRRDLTDVRDTVGAYVALVERAEPGIYNVCTGEGRRLRDLARRLAELAGSPDLEFELDPSRVRPDDPPVIVGDPSRLKAATSWAPQIPIDQTLADVLEDEGEPPR